VTLQENLLSLNRTQMLKVAEISSHQTKTCW
jgi:hypothetical protein